ncbi:hypothetical protein CQW23_28555 [Capsicum baccatum]|uniref:Receptor ligand binding region domain-containing protein n=1 Tax=Capsicum baccatum TaxID=33114 RepID=A0A2G2VGZ7_CAPBA|nr:hypothetical protein CQW23_28555 [Capsicum baccatum]
MLLAEPPSLIQMSGDVNSQMQCFAALIGHFKWRKVIALYEISNSFSNMHFKLITHLSDSLKVVDSSVEHHLAFPPLYSLSNSKSFIQEELVKLRSKNVKVFVEAQCSLHFGLVLFEMATEMGMMEKDYVWIISDNMASLLDSVEPSVLLNNKYARGQRVPSNNPESKGPFSDHYGRHEAGVGGLCTSAVVCDTSPNSQPISRIPVECLPTCLDKPNDVGTTVLSTTSAGNGSYVIDLEVCDNSSNEISSPGPYGGTDSDNYEQRRVAGEIKERRLGRPNRREMGIRDDNIVHGTAVPAEGQAGGIAILWHVDLLRITNVALTQQEIHYTIQVNLSASSWLLLAVYARNSPASRLSLWENIKRVSDSHNEPWLLGGNFNEVNISTEKFRGQALCHSRVNRFLDCLNYCGMVDLSFSGNYEPSEEHDEVKSICIPKTYGISKELSFQNGEAFDIRFGLYVEDANDKDHLICLLGTSVYPFSENSVDPYEWSSKYSCMKSFERSFMKDDRIMLILQYPQIFTLTSNGILERYRMKHCKNLGSFVHDWETEGKNVMPRKFNLLITNLRCLPETNSHKTAKVFAVFRVISSSEDRLYSRTRALSLTEGGQLERHKEVLELTPLELLFETMNSEKFHTVGAQGATSRAHESILEEEARYSDCQLEAIIEELKIDSIESDETPEAESEKSTW